jgi:hypothetical protein
MQPQHGPQDDFFASARATALSLEAHLRQQALAPGSHTEIENHIEAQAWEFARLNYQAFLDQCHARELLRLESTLPPGHTVRVRHRSLEPRFGTVTLRRLGLTPSLASEPTVPVSDNPSERETDFPLDRALHLPPERYTLPVRREVSQNAALVSVDNAIELLERSVLRLLMRTVPRMRLSVTTARRTPGPNSICGRSA